MSKLQNKILKILFIILCFVYINIAEASKTLDSKVIPITPNTYRKDPTEPKKAIRKPTITSTDKNKTTEKTSTSNTKTTIRSSSAITIPSKTTSVLKSSADKNKEGVAQSNSTSSESRLSSLLSARASASAKSNSTSNKKSSVEQNQTKTNSKSSQNLSKTTKTIDKPSKPQKIKEEKTHRKERIPEPIIKVKLGDIHTKITVSFPQGGEIVNSKNKRIKHLKNSGNFEWTSILDKNSKKKKIEYLNETLFFKPNKSLFSFNGTEYRGKLSLKLTSNGAIAVNELPIEDYLRGVVGREIGANSPQESLKAQSVIARTYAYANKGRHGSDNADVCNTTHCQVYFGKSAERDSVDKAIKDTKGYILTFNSKPISALYHATCGGMTSNNEEVWGGTPEPFLRRVVCNFCVNGTKYRWNQEISISELRKLLAKENIKLNEVYNVSIEAPSFMDRVTNLVFQTNTGETKVRGTTVRRIFNLPSTTFVLDDRNAREKIIASSKDIKNTKSTNSSPVKYKNTSGVFITSFSDSQYSPKQLLVYTSKGLKRSQLPIDGWKCISYKPLSKGIALSTESDDNYNIGKSNLNSIVTTIKPTNNKKKGKQPITKMNLFGRGFGHQVGLCQSGAVEMGKTGWNYRQILAHYYNGVALKNLGY